VRRPEGYPHRCQGAVFVLGKECPRGLNKIPIGNISIVLIDESRCLPCTPSAQELSAHPRKLEWDFRVLQLGAGSRDVLLTSVKFPPLGQCFVSGPRVVLRVQDQAAVVG